MFGELQEEMDAKFERYAEEIDLCKQRENKLMFFLYDLKEERKCPVTEVFEKFIKPIETARFTVDYGDNYQQVLQKVKMQNKYEKLFNKALSKMKLLNACRDYKSDSCIPEEIDRDLVEYKSKRNNLVFGKNEIKINKVKMPILDITSLG